MFKITGLCIKILVALAIIAGLFVIVVAYGDKISAWGKGLLRKFSSNDCVCDECDCVDEFSDDEETVVASENDFEG